MRSACHVGQLLPADFGKPKVYKPYLVVFRQHNVLGLNVAVDDAICVAVIQRRQNLEHVFGRLPLAKSFVFQTADFLQQVHAVDMFHDFKGCQQSKVKNSLTNVNTICIVVRFNVVDNVRVVKQADDVDFIHQTAEIVTHLLLVYDFDCYLDRRVVEVVALVHFPKRPPTKQYGRLIKLVVQLQLSKALLFVSLVFLNES